MCLQMCERMEGEREGKHLAAAGPSDPTIQCVKSLRLWVSKHGFPTLATVQLLCMLPQLVSVWGQALLKACFGARVEADLHLLQHKDLSWATWSPACSSLPNKMKRMPMIE